MTRLGKPFPLRVTRDCPNSSKHSWLSLELCWNFLKLKAVTINILAITICKMSHLESDQSHWLSTLLRQPLSMSSASVLQGSQNASFVEPFNSLRWLIQGRLLCKILLAHLNRNYSSTFFA